MPAAAAAAASGTCANSMEVLPSATIADLHCRCELATAVAKHEHHVRHRQQRPPRRMTMNGCLPCEARTPPPTPHASISTQTDAAANAISARRACHAGAAASSTTTVREGSASVINRVSGHKCCLGYPSIVHHTHTGQHLQEALACVRQVSREVLERHARSFMGSATGLPVALPNPRPLKWSSSAAAYEGSIGAPLHSSASHIQNTMYKPRRAFGSPQPACFCSDTSDRPSSMCANTFFATYRWWISAPLQAGRRRHPALSLCRPTDPALRAMRAPLPPSVVEGGMLGVGKAFYLSTATLRRHGSHSSLPYGDKSPTNHGLLPHGSQARKRSLRTSTSCVVPALP